MWTAAAVAVPILIGLAIGIPYGLKLRNKQNALKQKGFLLDRPYDFYKQVNLFTAGVSSLSDLNAAMETSEFRSGNIAWEFQPKSRAIVFSSGGFVSSVTELGYSEERRAYLYQYQLRSWSNGSSSGISAADHISANIVLTVLERAFLSLDYDAYVERSYAEFKVKTSFV